MVLNLFIFVGSWPKIVLDAPQGINNVYLITVVTDIPLGGKV